MYSRSIATFLVSTTNHIISSLCERLKKNSSHEYTHSMKENWVFHFFHIYCVTKYAQIRELGALTNKSLLHCDRKNHLACSYSVLSVIVIEKYITLKGIMDKLFLFAFCCFFWWSFLRLFRGSFS